MFLNADLNNGTIGSAEYKRSSSHQALGTKHDWDLNQVLKNELRHSYM
jgi:hypothetical protein